MNFTRRNIAPLALITSCALVAIAPLAHSEEKKVQVDTVVVSPNEPSADDKAAKLWKKTKKETGEAASTAAEYTKVQSKKALKKTKTGVAKGADAVADGSKKAWNATKDASKKAATATVGAAKKTGAVIKDAVQGEDQKAPVSERSVE